MFELRQQQKRTGCLLLRMQTGGDSSLSKLWELVMDRKVLLAAVHVVTKSQTLLSDLTELIYGI